MRADKDNPEQLDNIIDSIFDSEVVRQSALQDDNPVQRTVARLSDKGMQPQLSAAAKQEMLQQVLDSMPTANAPKVKPNANVLRPSFWNMLAKVAAGFVVAMLVAGLVAVPASANSLPGDVLYPVKRQVENFQRTIATAPKTRAEIYLNQAQTRLDEWQQLQTENEVASQVLDDGLISINEAVTIALEHDLYENDLAFHEKLNETLNAYSTLFVELEVNDVVIEDSVVDGWQENLDFILRRIIDVGASGTPGDFGCETPGNSCNTPGHSNGNANGNGNGLGNGNGRGNGNANGNGNGRGRP